MSLNLHAELFWCLNPAFADAVQRRIDARAAAISQGTKPNDQRPTMDAWGDEIAQPRMVNGVAIVPVKGPLLKGATGLDKKYGFVSYEDVVSDVQTAVAQKVKGIVLDISSPGGTAVGAGEAGKQIAAAAKSIPIASFTDSMQCSAAEYLSGACLPRFSTEDAIVGSIGTILTTVSIEGLLKQIGVQAHVITSGQFKGAGHIFKDLTPAQHGYLQNLVDTMAGEFKTHMQTHRQSLDASSMQGQVFTGKQAVASGLVDQNVGGLDEVVSLLAG